MAAGWGTAILLGNPNAFAANPAPPLLNEPVDVSDFRDFANTYYLADQLAQFDPATATGKITWQRAEYVTKQAFNNMLGSINPIPPNEFPANEYAANPALPFAIEFVSPTTLRLRATSGPQFHKPADELMLAGSVPKDDSWKYSKVANGHRYTSAFGSVTIVEKPWHIEIRDAQGKLLTQTDHAEDNKTSYTPILPFSFVRRTADYSRSMAAVFNRSRPAKRFSAAANPLPALDKCGQKVVLDGRRQWRAESRDLQADSLLPE